ncbi:helix-turn-helix domain-containing protein [Sphingomonas sp. 22R3R2A-7]|uniref:helix-turn-helix domain-containing protein n=1 Tax=Sphingomonas sp. 22R3R2A-7 TaxID=3050230 RepID=UPI003FA76B89
MSTGRPRALRKPDRNEQIMRLYRLGRTDNQMAELLGCTPRIVYRLWHGRAHRARRRRGGIF